MVSGIFCFLSSVQMEKTGTSTRGELQRAPAEAAQQVVFHTPRLDSEVAVSLDGNYTGYLAQYSILVTSLTRRQNSGSLSDGMLVPRRGSEDAGENGTT